MEIQHYKAALVAVWVLAICAIGFATGVASFTALAALAAAAVLPPLLMVWLWHDPDESLSESIQQARR